MLNLSRNYQTDLRRSLRSRRRSQPRPLRRCRRGPPLQLHRELIPHHLDPQLCVLGPTGNRSRVVVVLQIHSLLGLPPFLLSTLVLFPLVRKIWHARPLSPTLSSLLILRRGFSPRRTCRRFSAEASERRLGPRTTVGGEKCAGHTYGVECALTDHR